MKQFYDADLQRIYCFNDEASPEFWEKHWQQQVASLKYHQAPFSRVARQTSSYLPPGSRILEGGCGLGQEVYTLHHAGFRCTGVDYAEKTIAFVKQQAPELDVIIADVRVLPFADNSFDGYWSLGVIEHFPEGYDPIASEIRRVLRPGGILFITFPAFSCLRRLKAWLGFYPVIAEKHGDLTGFYQFMQRPALVAKHFEGLGFIIKKKHLFDATKGVKDEVALLKPLLEKIYHSRNFCLRVVRQLFNLCLSPLCGHSTFMILQKEN
ncbi:MAG: class I SAM-dependent methyltransferase [Planctomycetes bacterium]|nr:class I SAM-dependent methyltransferase [Planctomycetota bacterium]